MCRRFFLKCRQCSDSGLLHQHIRAGTAHRLLRPECRTVGRPAAICTAPLVRNLPCINTCPCSIWSIVCSVPFCRTAKTFAICGRPCETRQVKLRDRVGTEHILQADAGCRNTVFNGVAQTGAEFAQRFIQAGARYFRLEFLHESADQVTPDHPLLSAATDRGDKRYPALEDPESTKSIGSDPRHHHCHRAQR